MIEWPLSQEREAGSGGAIALKFSAEGASIVVADRKEELGQETVRLIERSGGKAMAIRTDVTRMSEVQQMVAKTLGEFKKVDILVNNAGWDKLGPFMETTSQFWDQIIDLNLKAHIYCTRAVLDHMIRDGRASLSISLRMREGLVSGERWFTPRPREELLPL